MKHNTFSGEVLQQRRLEMGLTVSEVSQKTRVPVCYLNALERGDSAALPPACYTTGFLKSYAHFLGLDPVPLIATYQGAVRPEPGRVFRRRTEDLCKRASQSRVMSSAVTWVGVCAFFALTWFAYTVVVQPRTDATAGQVEAAPARMMVPPAPGLDIPHNR
jgi:cytoskeletal protein RodZ